MVFEATLEAFRKHKKKQEEVVRETLDLWAKRKGLKPEGQQSVKAESTGS
ncbi:MAG: hypothetical protein JRD89_10895 [Deltaproteobacteria bacterium]|nr:hypothetical protein [Deltaproteobacteria bacterium]